MFSLQFTTAYKLYPGSGIVEINWQLIFSNVGQHIDKVRLSGIIKSSRDLHNSAIVQFGPKTRLQYYFWPRAENHIDYGINHSFKTF